MNTDERRLVRSCWREEGGGRNGSASAVGVVGLPKAQDMVLAYPVGFRLIIVPWVRSKDFPMTFLLTPCTNPNHAISFIFLYCEMFL
jgi:hypothetical protein